MIRSRRFTVGVDVGGTFTDCVIRDEQGGFTLDKAFTTPHNLADGIVDSLVNAAGRWGVRLDEVLPRTTVFKLGTTSPINRLISLAGAATALLTTKGHEDAVLLGRVRQKTEGLSEEARTDMRRWGKVQPLVPRSLIHGIHERIDSQGNVLCALDERSVESAVFASLEKGVESFAICFLWSFLNPIHERLARDIVARVSLGSFVVLSSDIAPIIGEYERASTTVLNAYLGPGTRADLTTLARRLADVGLRTPVLMMQSHGGVVDLGEAVSRPVHLLGSGPVGGITAAGSIARKRSGGDVIATDMGGTSFDVGVINRGQPVERPVSVHHRYRVLAPAIEVTSIGAGGGSIAFLDPVTGILQVGPRSAGSDPGPVCYGFGGTEPTVTDANAVLGRLNPKRFFAGRRELDIDASRVAIAAKIAEPAGRSVEEAAAAIVEIVDSRMADLIRTLSIERGLDPREFSLVAYGGCGPLHAASYAPRIGIRTVIVPYAAPVYSAWGIADSPVRQTYALSSPTPLPVPSGTVRDIFRELTLQADANQPAGGGGAASRRSLVVDVRYRYQVQELAVPLEELELDALDVSEIVMDRFETLYQQRFGSGTTFREAGIEISSFRLVVSRDVHLEAPVMEATRAAPIPVAARDVWYEGESVDAPVFDADDSAPGFAASGPCIVEGGLMTLVVHRDQHVTVDGSGDLVVTTTPPPELGR